MSNMQMFFTISLFLMATLMPIEAIHYQVINNATGTAGGTRFDNEIGIPWSAQTLRHASKFIWKIFQQGEGERNNKVEEILMIVEISEYIAYEEDNEIHVSTEYIANYVGDLMFEIKGILFHETTHVWQWFGNGEAPAGLTEGVADYVRLKAGLVPPHWPKRGTGKKWDEGYAVTAYFLEYCNGLKDGFVAKLNEKMKDCYSEDYLVHLLGKNVDDLWKDYKAKYNTTITT